MIFPTLLIAVQRPGGRDLHGQPILGATFSEKCCPVRLDFKTQNTTVRTDSAASHGHAHENAAQFIILVLPGSRAAHLDAVLTISGKRLRVVKVHDRYTVTGKLDHHQVECEAWV